MRNKEFQICLSIALLVSIIGGGFVLYIDRLAGVVALVSLLFVTIAFIIFTRHRYKDIDRLSEYLNRITSGEDAFDIRDHREGELSVLKSEIYKVTMMLSEQADALNRDKVYLADSISDISHQLKTPLTSMLIMTDLLCDEHLPPDKRKEFTVNIQSQLERLQWLVSALLKFSKLDADTVQFKKEKINIHTLIEKALEPLLIPLELKNIETIIRGEDSYFIDIDSNWTIEAVVNILKNCLEHTPINGTIEISYAENPIYSELVIGDNGEGIDKSDLPYIFKRFHKGKNAQDDSVGIGLALAHSIIAKQSGSIAVQSKKGEGTRFQIKFYKTII